MITFGTAGNVVADTAESFRILHENHLQAQEIEFVRSIYMKNEEAKIVGEVAKHYQIKLSVHASYFVNLASDKAPASKQRILDACERAHHMNANPVVFHAAYYQGKDKEDVFQIVKKEVLDMMQTIKQNGWNVLLAPEVTGKHSQFGDLDELLRLMKETGCSICIDFAHLKARNNGAINYNEIINKLKHLPHIHCHMSGIEFTEKGERKHLLTEKQDLKALIAAIKKANLSATIINESPDPFGDSKTSLALYKLL